MSSPSSDDPFETLPLIEALGVRTSWGAFPDGIGTLDRIGSAEVLAAAHAVATGRVISLSVPLDAFDPPLFGRPALQHAIVENGRNIHEDVLDAFNPQAASQWDGLLHVRAREHGFYGGITDLDAATATLGMERWAGRGIVGRGILVDVAAHAAAVGLAEWDPASELTLEPEALAAILDLEGVVPRRGDVLCLRFGWLADDRRRREAGEDRSGAGHVFAGLAAHDRMVEMLWNAGFAAVCADNPAVESAPGDPANGSLHRKLIPGLGFALGELFDLEALAAACSESGRYDFLFVAAPLSLPGGASSTANALAIL